MEPNLLQKLLRAFATNSVLDTLEAKEGNLCKTVILRDLTAPYREDVLGISIFENIHQVRELTDKFTEDYSQKHPHKSLNNMTPIEFLNHHSKKIPYFAVGF